MRSGKRGENLPGILFEWGSLGSYGIGWKEKPTVKPVEPIKNGTY
jgi:hypothetical protein